MNSDLLSAIVMIGTVIAAIAAVAAAWAAWVTIRLSRESKKSDISEWKGKVDADREAFAKFVDYIKEELRGINNKFNKLFSRLPPPSTTESHSPLTLSAFGREVADQLSAHRWAAVFAAEIWEDVEGLEDYEVHDFCFDIVQGQSVQEQWSQKIRQIAYLRGTTTTNVSDVLAIVLRDHILNRREEGGDKSTTEEELPF